MLSNQNSSNKNWLVVLTILKNISQWEGLSHILWKIKNVPNHQPENQFTGCFINYLQGYLHSMNRSGENPAIFPATIFPQSISCPVRTEETHEPVMTCDRGSKLGKLKCGGRKPASYIYEYTYGILDIYVYLYIRSMGISMYVYISYIYTPRRSMCGIFTYKTG